MVFPDPSLTLEQQFELKKFEACVESASVEELRKICVDLLRLKMGHENIAKRMVKADLASGVN
jgi:hypothetical protein